MCMNDSIILLLFVHARLAGSGYTERYYYRHRRNHSRIIMYYSLTKLLYTYIVVVGV